MKNFFAAFFCIFLFSASSFLVSKEKNEFVVTKKKKVTKRKTKQQAYELMQEKVIGCLERAKALAQGKSKELIQEALEGVYFFSDCFDGNDPLGQMNKKELQAFAEKQKNRMDQLQLQVSS